MERADWLEEKVDSADARFLMVTAITHHKFSSPIWGMLEIRKLQSELNDIARHGAEIIRENQPKDKGKGRNWLRFWGKGRRKAKTEKQPKYRGVFGAPA
jgi:hypothetical protein